MTAFIKKEYFQKTQHGLTLVEVIVSMLVSSLFLGTALQAYVAATAMRTQGGNQKEAIAIAQNDMEIIRDKAQDPNLRDPIYCASASGQGYGYKLMNEIKNQVADIPDANFSSYFRVVQRQTIAANPTLGQDAQEILIVEPLKPNGDPEYRLARTISVPSNSQILSKDTVKIAYIIKDIRPRGTVSGALGGGSPGGTPGAPNDVVVGQFDTAVIPAAALSCP